MSAPAATARDDGLRAAPPQASVSKLQAVAIEALTNNFKHVGASGAAFAGGVLAGFSLT